LFSDSYGAAAADAPSDSYGAAAPEAPSDSYGAASEDEPLASYGAEETTTTTTAAPLAAAPASNYGAANDEEEEEEGEEDYGDQAADPVAPPAAYGAAVADNAQPTYGNNELDAAASDSGDAGNGLKMLMNAVPGVPGEDYPIFSEAPETAFSCDGKVDGGNDIILVSFNFIKTNDNELTLFEPVYLKIIIFLQVTMLTMKLVARCSTFVLLTARAVSPSTASSAPMEPSSTRTTSSATGGSTLTALRLRPWPRPRTTN
jgi:hypothetical protein